MTNETSQNIHSVPTRFKSELYAADMGEKIYLEFEFYIDEDLNAKLHNNWKRSTGINPILNVINLMAMNTLQHTNVENYKILYIIFDENGITFKNMIDVNQVDKINERIEIFTRIPPWLFPKSSNISEQVVGNHITLWTLIQSSKIQENLKDSVVVTAKAQKIDDTKAMFEVNFNLFK